MSILARLTQKYPSFNSDLSQSYELTPEQTQILLNEQPSLAIEYHTLCIRFVALLNMYRDKYQAHLNKGTATPTPADKPDNSLQQLLDLKPTIERTLNEAKYLNLLLLKLYSQTRNHAAEQALLNSQAEKLSQFNAFKVRIPPSHSSDSSNGCSHSPHSAATSPADLPAVTVAVLKTASPNVIKKPEHFLQRVYRKITETLTTLRRQLVKKLEEIRAFISRKNQFRLFFARLRRYLLTIKMVAEVYSTHAGTYKAIIDPLEQYFLGPVLNYLSWLFLLPRLLINLGLSAWHTYHHDKLSLGQSFLIQLRERWFELLNDLVWVPGSILTCFFLLGPLGPVGLILGVAMFGWDVVNTSIRAIVELSRINQLIRQHTLQLDKITDKASKAEQLEFIAQLKAQRAFEIKRHALSIANPVLLTTFSFFAVSIIAFPITVPIIASTLLIIMSVVVYYLNASIAESRPQSKLETLEVNSYDTMLEYMGPTSRELPLEASLQEPSVREEEYDRTLPRYRSPYGKKTPPPIPDPGSTIDLLTT